MFVVKIIFFLSVFLLFYVYFGYLSLLELLLLVEKQNLEMGINTSFCILDCRKGYLCKD